MLSKYRLSVGKWVKESFRWRHRKKATLKPYGHLLIDLDSRADPKKKFSTDFSGAGPSTFFIATSKTSETVQNESERLLYA